MKTSFVSTRAGRRGFTLIELLTVIAIIGILAAILIPVVGRVREQSKRAKCMSNVRQITLSLVNFASSNKTQSFPINSGANWAWDVDVNLANEIANKAGRDVFYCPSSNMLSIKTMDEMFPYNGTSSFAVTGYVLLIRGTPQLDLVWLNDRVRSEYTVGLGNVRVTLPASRRPLVVDAIISNGPNTFVGVEGGFAENLSNHMAGVLPMGGHTGYVDGSVKWRNFVSGSNPFDPAVFTRKTNSDHPSFWF